MDDELESIRARRREEILRGELARKVEVGRVPDLDETQFDAFLGRHRLVLVDVWAPWCGPCRIMSPLVEDLSRAWGARVAVAKLNSDLAPTITTRYRILGIPTFLWFKDGRLAGRHVGVQPREAFEQALAELESA